MMRNGYDYEIIVSERVDQCEREFAEREPAEFPDSPPDVRSIEQQIHTSLHFVQKSLSESNRLVFVDLGRLQHLLFGRVEETEVHRLSRARTRVNTSAAGREEISPRRYASYRRVASSSQSCSTFSSKSSSKESISVRANSAFCFGLSLSNSSRSFEISRVIFVTPKCNRKVLSLLIWSG